MSFKPPRDDLASNIESIFKYREIKTTEDLNRVLDMLQKRALWFWHVTDQNDKNECKPKVFFRDNFSDRLKYFRNDFREALPHISVKILEEKARKAARKPNKPSPENIKKMHEHWTICCFSADGDHPYLWKTYGGNGEGLAIEYEAKENTSIGLAARVKYQDAPVLVDLIRIDEKKCYEIFTTKEKRWEIEKEYRLVQRLKVPKSGINILYSDIKILSVRIGESLKCDFRSKIIQVCEKEQIKIYKPS